MEAWFLSDIHLKNINERNGKILLRFLHSLKSAEHPVQLFLLGDIFDIWIGDHLYFVNQFKPLIDLLKELKNLGHKIVYIEGNHDLHIERFFQETLGIEVFVSAQYFDIGELRVRCEHGDLINTEDKGYLKYRSVVRHPFVKKLSLSLPGHFWGYVGKRVSQKSRLRSGHFRQVNELRLIEMIRGHIAKAYGEGPFDYIISGHMHVFDDHIEMMNGSSVRSINLGSWFEESVRVFCIRKGKGEWIILPAIEG